MFPSLILYVEPLMRDREARAPPPLERLGGNATEFIPGVPQKAKLQIFSTLKLEKKKVANDTIKNH